MMSDSLVEIERKDLQILKELYAPDGMKSYIAYTTIENYIRWFEQDSNIKHVKFFCLNGDFSDGTFVVTDRCAAFADTNNKDHDRLFKLCTLLDYSKGYTFLSIRIEIQSIIENAIKYAGIELIMNDYTLLYYCPKEIAAQFEIIVPNDIELRELTALSHLEKANSVWPHRNPNSLAFFQRMAKYNVNIGAFKDDDTLVAWMLRLSTGLLGALQTDADHFGHGYGTLVTKYVSKKIAEMGHDIYAGIFEENHPSRQLFEKLGFKSIGKVHWITTKINWTFDDE